MLDLPVDHPARHLELGLGEARHVVEHEEALHAGALDDQLAVVRRPGRRLGGVVHGDGPAQHHAGSQIDPVEDGLEDRATDVVEEDVDTVRARGAQAAGDIFGAVVDARVEPQLVGDPRALLVGARDPDHAATADLGDLAGDGAGGAGRARNDHGLPVIGAPDVEHTEVGSHARDPVDADRVEQGLQRRRAGIDRLRAIELAVGRLALAVVGQRLIKTVDWRAAERWAGLDRSPLRRQARSSPRRHSQRPTAREGLRARTRRIPFRPSRH